MREAIYKAVYSAFEALGLNAFKATTLFISNRKKDTARPWLVDREGVTYLPERKVVLKAKQSKLQA